MSRYLILAFLGGVALAVAGCAQEPKLPTTLVVVLPDEDGQIGGVTVDDGINQVTLDSAMAAAQVDAAGQVAPAEVAQADVNSMFGDAIDGRPMLPRSFVLYFLSDRSELTEDSKVAFESVFSDIAVRPHYEIEVIGHTDTMASDEYNATLSFTRANAVRAMLAERGIDPGFIKTTGRGERDLLIPTEDEVPEERNRRVEISVR